MTEVLLILDRPDEQPRRNVYPHDDLVETTIGQKNNFTNAVSALESKLDKSGRLAEGGYRINCAEDITLFTEMIELARKWKVGGQVVFLSEGQKITSFAP